MVLRFPHHAVRFVLAVMAGLVVSCGGAARKPVYPVHGQVFVGKDQPASGALVVFHHLGDDDLNKPRAYVEEDGSFSLTTYAKGDGAPEGEYVVTIEWRPPSANPFGSKKLEADKLKGRYSDPKKSSLRCRIEKTKENVLEPILLR
jgi:hypothetical protein